MLVVNEIYGKILQGEGKSAGKEMMFIRLSGCNLACVWCDTPYTWNWVGTNFAHPDKFDPKKESHPMTDEQIIEKLMLLSKETKAVILSGGEPLLQQKNTISLLTKLKALGYWIEVETNGTVEPTDDFVKLIDQINCSPKLTNSGPDNPLRKREIPASLHKLASLDKTSFKFVVVTEQDLKEAMDLISRYNMKSIYLMPEGRTKDEQLARQNEVEIMCKEHGFNFSPRLHILEFGNKRGV